MFKSGGVFGYLGRDDPESFVGQKKQCILSFRGAANATTPTIEETRNSSDFGGASGSEEGPPQGLVQHDTHEEGAPLGKLGPGGAGKDVGTAMGGPPTLALWRVELKFTLASVAPPVCDPLSLWPHCRCCRRGLGPNPNSEMIQESRPK